MYYKGCKKCLHSLKSEIKLILKMPSLPHECFHCHFFEPVNCNLVGSLGRPPSWTLLTGQSFSICDTVWAIPHTHTRLTALCQGLPRSAATRKVKPIRILLKQETVSGTGICWAIFKSAPRSRQTTTPAPHHSAFYRPDALFATQPTASKHWMSISFHPYCEGDSV